MEQRKADHIDMALQAQMDLNIHDSRFHYEPLLRPHPKAELTPFKFLGKQLRVPIWVSSMTGGTSSAREINTNLARACREFGMGMGLGSCRVLLESDDHLADFALRDVIGDDQPLYANLGISQVEKLIHSNQVIKIHNLVSKLRADGLIIHVNPLQEWFQPEGDHLQHPPLDTIKRFLYQSKYPVIIKEVGQGIGPASLRELFRLPLAAIEFAACGGTNFVRVELIRNSIKMQQEFESFSRIGESAADMVNYVNEIMLTEKNPGSREIIISGGIRSFLDGYYLIKKLKVPAIYGQASGFLVHARQGYEQLRSHVESQVHGLKLAFAYLTIKS